MMATPNEGMNDPDYGAQQRADRLHNRQLFINWTTDSPPRRVRWRTYALALVLVVALALFLWSKGL